MKLDDSADPGAPPEAAVMPLGWGGRFQPATGALSCGHSAGFFSSCCVTLWNLREVLRAGHTAPSRIDFSRGFAPFRGPADAEGEVDLYPKFFQARLDLPAPRRLPWINQHGVYGLLDYRAINVAMKRHFTPSAAALEIADRLQARYRIDPAQTLAVVYRGTDKGTEVRLAPPQRYVEIARRLMYRHPGLRIWIQTDEPSVRDLFLREFGERCFWLREMPMSSDGRVVHQQSDDALPMSRSEFGVLLVAVVHLLSRCRLVVNHTGNMALWTCLFRGHGQGVWQFDDEARLIQPERPGLWWGALRRVRIKAVRKLKRLFGSRPDT